jgi:hypothetical protein
MTPRAILRLLAAAALAFTLGACGSGFDDPGPIGWHAPGASPRVVRGGDKLQCVPYARARSGVQIWGDATVWWSKAAGRFQRSALPETGAVMVMRGYDDNDRGHVAVVRRALNEREIVVDHANWLNSGEVGLDTPVMDVSDDNDWSEVRVWYAPGRHYGGRVYEVTGFILGPSDGQRMAAR